MKIIRVPASGCADDIAGKGIETIGVLILTEITNDLSNKRRYLLQPTKSAIIETAKESSSYEYTM